MYIRMCVHVRMCVCTVLSHMISLMVLLLISLVAVES